MMDPEKTALVLIECQNDFTSEGGTLHQAVKPFMDSTNMLANTVETVAKRHERHHRRENGGAARRQHRGRGALAQPGRPRRLGESKRARAGIPALDDRPAK
jgi:nicotinamidase-related amidase